MSEVDVAVDRSVRVVGIYATQWRHRGEISGRTGAGSSEHRLTTFYGYFRGQLPRLPGVLWHREISADQVAFQPEVPGVALTSADSWLFVLPSDQVVAAITLDVSCPGLGDVAMVLDRCTFDGMTINGADPEAYISQVISILKVEGAGGGVRRELCRSC